MFDHVFRVVAVRRQTSASGAHLAVIDARFYREQVRKVSEKVFIQIEGARPLWMADGDSGHGGFSTF